MKKRTTILFNSLAYY